MNRPASSFDRTRGLVAVLVLLAALAGLTSVAAAAPRQEAEAAEPEAFTTLTLLNGWTNYGDGTNAAKVSLANGVVRFKGAIATAGFDPVAFVLPPGLRPSKRVYIPIDLCDAANGRLLIQPDGTVAVHAGDAFSDAQCFTSLEGASFTLAPAGEVNLGLIPGYGGTQRLPRLVGKGRALEMLLTGDPIGAEEAHRIGLVNRVVEPAELLPASFDLLRKILSRAPAAVRATLEAVHEGLEMPFDQAEAFEATHFGLCIATEDMREGVSAFLEKRPPRFTGR